MILIDIYPALIKGMREKSIRYSLYVKGDLLWNTELFVYCRY